MARRLQLDAMDERHRGLTPSLAGAYSEAAAVCLNRRHSSPLLLTVTDNGTSSDAEVSWVQPDGRTLAAWANEIDATEAGAYGCVIAAIEEMRGLVAVRRAATATGCDYYVGLPGAGQNDLEDCLRLEVSGTDAGDYKEVARRVLSKLQQLRDGRSSLPAIAGVIGFGAGLLVVRDLEENQ